MGKTASTSLLSIGATYHEEDEFPIVTVAAVDELMHEYRTMRCRTIPMDFIGRLISTAKMLLGANPVSSLREKWEKGGFLVPNEHNYLFLLDTMYFITKGYRPMEPSNRLMFMDTSHVGEEFCPVTIDCKLAQAERLKDKTWISGIDTSKSYTYADWLKHPNGVNDLLSTLVVLYGDISQLCCNK